MTNNIAFHPLADVFPLLESEQFNELAEDIKANGLHVPIVILDGQIIDGRNRYRACLAAEVEPRFVTFDGSDPVAFVISKNLKRRHLDESQRALVATKLATLRDGQRPGASIEAASQSDAAKLLNVSRSAVQRARTVSEKGTTELLSAVEAGKIAVSAAATIARQSPEVQRQIVHEVVDMNLPAAAAIRRNNSESKQVKSKPKSDLRSNRIAIAWKSASERQRREFALAYCTKIILLSQHAGDFAGPAADRAEAVRLAADRAEGRAAQRNEVADHPLDIPPELRRAAL